MDEKEKQLLSTWENSFGRAVMPEQLEEWSEDFKECLERLLNGMTIHHPLDPENEEELT